MKVLEFAMQMELDGKKFYEKGAEATDNKSLRKVFETLAEEEHRHYHVFKKLLAGEKADPKTDLAPKGSTVSLVKNVFQEMAESGQETLAGDTVKSLWQTALSVEKKSEEMYRMAANNETDAHKKEMLNRIADEEKNHIYLIDNMISFLNDPQSFAQSQDYRSFMSWEGL